ncbi:hypothetical protein MGWOODY_Hyp1249 [hydrothermal vent metagenome]|uniref:Uncharacterized protein n=1 Tax=hydrothermal vent metagenome TaxID=652676 RepID=A0A160U4G3_9ZZZZ
MALSKGSNEAAETVLIRAPVRLAIWEGFSASQGGNNT